MGEDLLLVDYANQRRKGPRPEEPLYDDDPVYAALREAFPTVHFHSKKRTVDVVAPKKRVAIAKKRNGKGTKGNGVKKLVRRRVPRRRPDAVYDFTCKEILRRHEHDWRKVKQKSLKNQVGIVRVYSICSRENCRARAKFDIRGGREKINFEIYTKVR
jgi:hypothetical protein